MFVVSFLRIRNSVLQTILVVLFFGMGLLFLSDCYMPDAYGAGVPETQIFHKQLFAFILGDPLPLNVAVTDPDGVAEVRCYFRFDRSAPFVYSIMASAGEHKFTTKLPAATSTVKDVEYLFLVVNGRKQAILSSTFAVNKMDVQKGYADGAQNSVLERYQLKAEVDGTGTVKNYFLQPANVQISPALSQDRYGVLAGLYSREQLDSDIVSGYFGAFRLDPQNNIVAVKGSIVTRRASALSASQGKSTAVKEAAVGEQVSVPQIAGSSWKGLFWRSNDYENTVKPVTATVTQEANGKVLITTSLTGLGHSFEGEIYNTGHMLVNDTYDDEIWSTLDGPVNDLYIKIEDYVVPPTDYCKRPEECTRPEECLDPTVPPPEICNAPLPAICYEPLPDECVHWPLNIIELKRSTNERVPIGALLLLL
jgi:hypothetical protein